MTADIFASSSKDHLPQCSAVFGPAGSNAQKLSLGKSKLSQLTDAFAALWFIQEGIVLGVSFARLASSNHLCRCGTSEELQT